MKPIVNWFLEQKNASAKTRALLEDDRQKERLTAADGMTNGLTAANLITNGLTAADLMTNGLTDDRIE